MPCLPDLRGRKESKECKEFPVIQAAPKGRKESKAMMGRWEFRESKARLAMMGRQEPKVCKESKAMKDRSARKEAQEIQAAPLARKVRRGRMAVTEPRVRQEK